MKTTLSTKSQDRLGQTAANFSRRVADKLARTEQQVSKRLAERREEEAKRTREREKTEHEKARLIAKRRRAALNGIDRILTLGKNDQVQKIIHDLHQVDGDAQLTFYFAERYDGDSWYHNKNGNYNAAMDLGLRCEVSLFFLEDALSLDLAYYSPRRDQDSVEWKLFYKPSSHDTAVGRMGSARRLTQHGLGELFTSIETLDQVRLPSIRDVRNQTYEWEPNQIAFQLLTRCASGSVFDRYVAQCLSGVEKMLQRP